MGLVCGDYDNDGDVDLFVANDQTANFLYQNNGDGTFADVALIAGVGYSGDGRMEASMGADFGDYDNDGFLDLVVPNFQREAYQSLSERRRWSVRVRIDAFRYRALFAPLCRLEHHLLRL